MSRTARRWSGAAAAGVAALVASAIFVVPAGAGDADGCTWTVRSLDADGRVIDTASGPGPGATKSDPLSIDPEGSITYQGTTDQVVAHGSWSVETSGGLAISFGGDVTNDEGDTEKSGTEELESRLTVDIGPFGTVAVISGLVHVDFEATGEGGARCTASGWVETTGSPFGNLVFIAGSLLSLFGIALLVVGWPVAPGGGVGDVGARPGPAAAGGVPTDGPGPRPGPIGGAT